MGTLDDTWKIGIERELGAVKTDIAKIEAHGEAQMAQLSDIARSVSTISTAQNTKQPLVPLVVMALALLGAGAGYITMVTNPILGTQEDLKKDVRTLEGMAGELQYKAGKNDAIHEREWREEHIH